MSVYLCFFLMSDHPRQLTATCRPPPTTALKKVGRECHNTSAKHNSCVLHSVIAEVHRIHQLQHITFARQSERLRSEIAIQMQHHPELWINNASSSTANMQAPHSTPIQQLNDRIASCRQSGTYLGIDQLHVMATMLHSHGIRIVPLELQVRPNMLRPPYLNPSARLR